MKRQYFISFEKYSSNNTLIAKSWRIFTIKKWFISDISGVVSEIISDIEREESVNIHIVSLNRI